MKKPKRKDVNICECPEPSRDCSCFYNAMGYNLGLRNMEAYYKEVIKSITRINTREE